MKQLHFIFFWVMSIGLWSQAQQGIPYQAVMRNADGTVISNAVVTLTFKIHDVAATGEVVYEETHAVTSNSQGLVSMNVGSGTVVTGAFDNINWGAGNKFLQVIMNAGNGNVDLGTQQMMSVPYALYAEDVSVRVSLTGDSLFIGDQVSIVLGVSAANLVSSSNYGSVLLPGNTTCQNEFISVTGCGGQDSLLYYDRYYSLTEIGGQCWFAENLATDKYSNGDLLGQDVPLSPQDNLNWMNATTGMYSIANGSMLNDELYGKLYNWYAAVDGRGVCPIGWHTPSDCEWMFLEKSVGVILSDLELTGNRGGNAGNALKSNIGWNSPSTPANNSSGFRALPGGIRGEMAIPITLGYSGFWWAESQNESNITNLHARKLQSSPSSIYRYQNMYTFSGLSIRCVKD